MNKAFVSLLSAALLVIVPALHAQQSINVWIKVPSSIPSNGMVSGTTNLPEGTILNLHLIGPPSSAINAALFDAVIAVREGKFGPVAVVPGGMSLPPGPYTLEIMAPGPKASGKQPSTVVLVTGEDDEHLTGPLVKSIGTAQVPMHDVEATFPVTVP